MITLIDFFQLGVEFLSTPYFCIPVHIISLILISKIIISIVKSNFTHTINTSQKTILLFFLIPIIAVFLDNSYWIIRYFMPKTITSLLASCIAWIFCCIKPHFFGLFLENLTEKKFQINFYHKVIFVIEGIISCLFIINTINRIQGKEPVSLAINLYYFTNIFWFLAIIKIVQKISHNKIPLILKEQIRFLFYYFLLPHFIFLFFELFPIILLGQKQIAFIVPIESILVAIFIHLCFKKIINFRFLNMSKQVQIYKKFSTDIDFKQALEQINIASTIQEFSYITQQLISKQTDTNKSLVNFYVRSMQNNQDSLQQKIECFFNNTDLIAQESVEVIQKHKILVRHELEFDEFYTDNPNATELAQFLRSIECDIFVPIIGNNKIIGYIIISFEEKNTLLSQEQLNKFVIFAQFLSPAIHLMLQKDLYHVLQDSKSTQEALHVKTQEINQYKESIKQLLKDRIEYHIGIIFYKNRHFALKNLEAQTLLGFNPNLDEKHITTATLLNFVQQIEKYQSTQTICITSINGSKLIITGMPQAEVNSGILLIIRKPEATDLIKMHIDALNDHSQRDFLLYLQTTKAGISITKWIPANDEPFLKIKIELLKSILQRTILLIQGNQQDRNYITEMIHNLTHENVFISRLTARDENSGIKLFGINHLVQENQELSLLEKFQQGTIIINDIEHLNTITQQKFVQYIKYGIFTPYKSEQRKFSNARIICSTDYDLSTLEKEGKIIPEFAHELKKHTLNIPSLVTMPENNLHSLIDQYMYQNLQEYGTEKIAALSLKDKEALVEQRIASIFELQQKVFSCMTLKAQNKLELNKQEPILKNIDSSCPELQLAAQLGKHALKDVQLMKKLWDKLGSQTKIAELLGVNRSSVSRRCKDYHLI